MIDYFTNLWKGKDVFIIGGGPSMRRITEIARLEKARVIGVNDAYKFGEAVVNVLFFGDEKWWRANKEALDDWHAPIVTNSEKLGHESSLIKLPRKLKGFHRDALGWNGNSGASAINLALIMGAKRIYLLGFDMCHDVHGNANWHNDSVKPAVPENYVNYRRDIEASARLYEFPETEIINLNPDSALECFPKMDWELVLGAL